MKQPVTVPIAWATLAMHYGWSPDSVRSMESVATIETERDGLQRVNDQHAETIVWQAGRISELTDEIAKMREPQPRLTVRLTAFPESNGKRNWTALLVRVDKWDGLVGNCGGISLARGELWNRVAWEAECTRFLIGERDTEPFILDYGDDIQTPEEWAGETYGCRVKRCNAAPGAQP